MGETDKNKNAASAEPVEEKSSDRATKISFSAAGLGGARTNWEAVMWQERAFVSLLEYAEEELEVTHVVACLDRLHHDNKKVWEIDTFSNYEDLQNLPIISNIQWEVSKHH